MFTRFDFFDFGTRRRREERVEIERIVRRVAPTLYFAKNTRRAHRAFERLLKADPEMLEAWRAEYERMGELG